MTTRFVSPGGALWLTGLFASPGRFRHEFPRHVDDSHVADLDPDLALVLSPWNQFGDARRVIRPQVDAAELQRRVDQRQAEPDVFPRVADEYIREGDTTRRDLDQRRLFCNRRQRRTQRHLDDPR